MARGGWGSEKDKKEIPRRMAGDTLVVHDIIFMHP